MLPKVVATANQRDDEWGWDLFALVETSLENIGTLVLQSLLGLVGDLALSFCLFSCLMTLVRRLCETAVSPPHQMIMTTEVNMNDLMDLANVLPFIGDPNCHFGDDNAYCPRNDPDLYEPPFSPDCYY
jgi:hypothetical protein